VQSVRGTFGRECIPIGQHGEGIPAEHRECILAQGAEIAAAAHQWLRAHPNAPPNMLVVIARESVVPKTEPLPEDETKPPDESGPEAHRARGPPKRTKAAPLGNGSGFRNSVVGKTSYGRKVSATPAKKNQEPFQSEAVGAVLAASCKEAR